MDVLKVFLNTLRCPVCGGLIDMFEGRAVRRRFNYACAADYKHYGIYVNVELSPPFIEEEVLEISDKNHMYMIIQFHDQFLNKHMCNIDSFDINGDGNIVGSSKGHFSFHKTLFDFKNSNKVKLLNKIKTILVFQ